MGSFTLRDFLERIRLTTAAASMAHAKESESVTSSGLTSASSPAVKSVELEADVRGDVEVDVNDDAAVLELLYCCAPEYEEICLEEMAEGVHGT